MCRANPANESCVTLDDMGAAKQPLHLDRDVRCPVTGVLSDITRDYVVLPRVLGKGHYGTVRECVCRSTRREYAVKSIEKARIGRVDHLRREVELIREMDHASIMRTRDVYEDMDYLHIVTPKYTGGELFDKIIENTTSEGCFDERTASSIVKSLLEAVAYLHKNGVVHRDIKPENVLFETNEEGSAIKLIDFGLSRRHKRGDSPMTNPVGTAYYMSPELLKGRYGAATDLWSIGVVAYIVMSGYPPFNADTDPEIFEAIRRGHFDFPSQGWADKSSEAKDFVRALLRRDPRKRMTAEEALRHPWIAGKAAVQPAGRGSFLKGMRRTAVRPL